MQCRRQFRDTSSSSQTEATALNLVTLETKSGTKECRRKIAQSLVVSLHSLVLNSSDKERNSTIVSLTYFHPILKQKIFFSFRRLLNESISEVNAKERAAIKEKQKMHTLENFKAQNCN